MEIGLRKRGAVTSKSGPLTLSIDIGTSSTRVLLWNADGREVADTHTQVQYQMHTTPDGGVEMAADELLDHIARCLDEALARAANHSHRIQAVGISTFWHAFMGADQSGKPLTPIFNWADNRSADIAQRLRRDLDADSIHARTGCVVHPSYYPAKLVWLREKQADVFAACKRWLSPSEYLVIRLFGPQALYVSTSMASGTGLFNQTLQTWDTELIQQLDLDETCLSEIVDVSHHSSGLSSEYANRWPALKSVSFYAAVGDGACGNIGSGCVSPDKFAINLGTSGAIRAVWTESGSNAAKTEGLRNGTSKRYKSNEPGPGANNEKGAVPEGLWRYRVDSRRPIIGAAFSDGGDVYAWMCRTLQLPDGDQLEQELSEMSPGKHGLIFLPFLAGERSMGWNPAAHASLIGLNLDSSPVEILRAAMESVALQFADAANRLHSIFPRARQIIASGGALGHSRAWRQIFADAIGVPLTVAAEPEASSRGAALLAMEAAGIVAHTANCPARISETIEPDLVAHAIYQEALQHQHKAYEALM